MAREAHEHDHRELEAKMMQVRMLEMSLQGMMKNQDLLMTKINEIESTLAGIEELSRAGGELKFHIGDGVFFPAKVSENKKIIVSVGAEVALEKTPEEARKILEGRRVETNKALVDAQKEIERLTKGIEALIPEIEAHQH